MFNTCCINQKGARHEQTGDAQLPDERGADRDGMKAISDAVISSISSARVARGEEGLSDDEVNDAREKASGIIDGAFADNAGKER